MSITNSKLLVSLKNVLCFIMESKIGNYFRIEEIENKFKKNLSEKRLKLGSELACRTVDILFILFMVLFSTSILKSNLWYILFTVLFFIFFLFLLKIYIEFVLKSRYSHTQITSNFPPGISSHQKFNYYQLQLTETFLSSYSNVNIKFLQLLKDLLEKRQKQATFGYVIFNSSTKTNKLITVALISVSSGVAIKQMANEHYTFTFNYNVLIVLFLTFFIFVLYRIVRFLLFPNFYSNKELLSIIDIMIATKKLNKT